MQISSEMLVGVAGVVLSLLFSYIPGLRVWYAALKSEFKQLLMLGLLIVVSGAIFALGCYDILSTGIACDKYGAISLVWMFIAALVANQATYAISPQPNDVIEAKAVRDDGGLG